MLLEDGINGHVIIDNIHDMITTPEWTGKLTSFQISSLNRVSRGYEDPLFGYVYTAWGLS